MRISIRQTRVWVQERLLDCSFFLVFLTGGIVLVLSLIGCIELREDATVTLFCGLLAGAVVWWQIYLLARQVAYSTVLDLYKEWNSPEMLLRRQKAWIVERESPNPETIEDVLEFLEKVSTLERRKYISRHLIWDTFGWYISRYYYYCKRVIDEDLRKRWTNASDPTLYQDLEDLYTRLVEVDAEERNLKVKDIELEYDDRKGKFILSERK